MHVYERRYQCQKALMCRMDAKGRLEGENSTLPLRDKVIDIRPIDIYDRNLAGPRPYLHKMDVDLVLRR